MALKSRDDTATNKKSLARVAAEITAKSRAKTGKIRDDLAIPDALLDALRSFPIERQVEHCGQTLSVSPFEHYVKCPRCGTRLKLRSFSAVPEIEDVFDAVFEWLLDPEARRLAEQRQQTIQADLESD